MTSLRSHELYPIWWQMKQRCNNPNNTRYSAYGARGISVCQRWLHSFANFLADMGERPAGLTLDRIDTNGDYTPDNCVWSDERTQLRNRRTMYESSCISQRSSGKYRVRIALQEGVRHQRQFDTLEEAEDYVSLCRFEREMYWRLGGV